MHYQYWGTPDTIVYPPYRLVGPCGSLDDCIKPATVVFIDNHYTQVSSKAKTKASILPTVDPDKNSPPKESHPTKEVSSPISKQNLQLDKRNVSDLVKVFEDTS